jgi:hypothetical protein
MTFRTLRVWTLALLAAAPTALAMSDRMSDNGDGTVSDSATGLVWQQTDDNTLRTWAEALQYCEDLELAGQSDWRLPNVKELVSISDKDARDPAIDESVFGISDVVDYEHYPYYSSTPSTAYNPVIWGVDFQFGQTTEYAAGSNPEAYARCVRSGGEA